MYFKVEIIYKNGASWESQSRWANIPSFFPVFDSIFLHDLCNPKALDQSPARLKALSFSLAHGDKSFNKTDSDHGPLFA